MYRGENPYGIESGLLYSGQYLDNILILPCRGGIPLCLKGFSLGILCMKKRGMEFFWGKDIENL